MSAIYKNGLNYGFNLPYGGQTGQALSKVTAADGDIDWQDVGVIFTYIVGATPFASGWLSKTDLGAALVPDSKLIYLILSPGYYYHYFVRWDSTANSYVQVDSDAGSVVFAYIKVGETALSEDWLVDAYNKPITGKYGVFYVIQTAGQYKDSIYRYDETLDSYVLVQANDLVEISQATFNLLPEEEQNNGKAYFITDGNVMDKAYLASVGFTPIGTIITLVSDSEYMPNHYLLCDGKEYPIIYFQALADYFEENFGSCNIFGGDGIDTFSVPNLINSLSDKCNYYIAVDNIYIDYRQAYSSSNLIVGSWEDGTARYQVTITGTTISGTFGAIPTGLAGISYAELDRFQVSNGNYVKNLLDSVSIKIDGSEILMVADSESTFINKPFKATISYKKAEL